MAHTISKAVALTALTGVVAHAQTKGQSLITIVQAKTKHTLFPISVPRRHDAVAEDDNKQEKQLQ